MHATNNLTSMLARMRRVGFAGLFVALATSFVQAATPTSVALTSGANPSTPGQSVSFSAKISSGILVAPFAAGISRLPGISLYYRYDLTGATFRTAVLGTDLTNPNLGAFASVVVFIGGGVADRYVVLAATAGGIIGIDAAHMLQFGFDVGTPTATDAIAFSVHETGSSAFGAIPANSALLYSRPAVLLSTLLPTTFPGTITFRNGGVPIAGCNPVPVTGDSAQCVAPFAAAGTFAITANYSGGGVYDPSSGTLAGGQVVGLLISPSTHTAVVAAAYSTTLTGIGGTAPYTFTLESGTLPVGLTLNAVGVLSGTPVTAGTYLFSVRVTDSVASSGAQAMTLVVGKGAQTITFTPPATVAIGSTLTLNATASSMLPVTYSVGTPTTCSLSGDLLSFTAAGTCSVTPLQNGDANYFAAPTSVRSIMVSATGGPQAIRVRSAVGTSMVGSLVGNQIVFAAENDPGSDFRLVAVTADLNRNGVADLVYQNLTQGEVGDVSVWRDYSPATPQLLRGVKLAWRVDAVGDLDGDGSGDLVWRFTGQTPNIDDTGVSYVWFTNGTGVTEVRKRGGAPLSWALLGAIDVNRDNAADVIYVSPDRQIRALMATPNRTCANLSAGTLPSTYTAMKLGDFTGNRYGEIFIRELSTGQNRILVLNGTGLTLPAATANPNDPNASCTSSSLSVHNTVRLFFAADVTWQFYAAADLNGDSVMDIVWLKPDGTLAVWIMARDAAVPTVLLNAGTAPVGFTVLAR